MTQSYADGLMKCLPLSPQNGNDCIVLFLTRNYKIISFNKLAELHLGSQKKDILGKNYLKICQNPKLKTFIIKNTKSLLKNPGSCKSTITSTKILNAYCAEIRWVFLSSPQSTSKLKLALIGNIVEVHQTLKKANYSYSSGSSLTNKLLDFPGNFYCKNLQGSFTYANQSFLKIIGLKSLQNIIDKKDDDLWININEVEIIKRNDQEVIKTGKTMQFEEAITLKNGNHLYFMTIKTPNKNNNNKIIGIICNSIDITNLKTNQLLLTEEKKRAEIVSKRVHHYLESIVDSLPGSIYWKNKDGVYLGCNSFMVRTAGLTSLNDIIGKTDYQLWPEQADELRKNDKEVMDSGEAMRIEETVRLPNGNQRYFTVAKVPLRNEDGSITGIVGNSLEITDLKQTQFELQKEKKKAEAANHAKSAFLATISHELRTPLNGILGITQILNKKKLPEQTSIYVKEIYHSGKHLLTLVNDILDLSKLEAKKLELKNDFFRIRDLINDVISKSRIQIEQKPIKLFVEADKKIPEILFGDPFRIKQILLNLLGNAIKFTKKGYIKIKADCKFQNKNKIILSLLVEDTGIGIPKDKINKIFERFSQIESHYSRRFEGTGLGLAICKQLLDLMGGKIKVSTTLGKGSTFFVTMPLKISHNKPKKFANDIEEIFIKKLGKIYCDVLLVEDNPLNQKIAKIFLEEIGCKVTLANTGLEALHLIKNNKYQLIFMDISLPDMDGIQVTKKIRKYFYQKNELPIIALTAHALPEEKEKFIKSGLNYIITKPINQNELYNLVKKLLLTNITEY